LNDWFGFQQAALLSSGIVPSGSSDTEDVSQMLTALMAILSPPGTLIYGGYNDTPANLGLRLILLDGTSVLIANYADLVANTYVGDGNNATVAAAGGKFYKSSDSGGASPNIAGPYFQLPDMRGQYPRGLDPSGTVDPDGASRYLGDTQGHAILEHVHRVWEHTGKYLFSPLPAQGFSAGSRRVIELISDPSGPSASAFGASVIEPTSTIDSIAGVPTVNQSGDEVRPVNIAWDAFIRY
jgi:hypothetical protein